MPRRARLLLPGTPHHVVQRGHNRSTVFLQAEHYDFYLDNLREFSRKLNIKVHAFCLMTNHVHLMLEPDENAASISQLMKRLAGRQCRYVNRLEERSGTLWEGRFKSSPIQRDTYFLQCCRYIELNPVKAHIVTDPEEYPWSSYAHRIGAARVDWMGKDQVLPLVSERPADAIAIYRRFVARGCPDQHFIQTATDRNQLLGNDSFISEVERRTGVRVEARQRGRPRK